MKYFLCILFSIWALAAEAVTPAHCVQEKKTIYLDVLQVNTCLISSGNQVTGSEEKVPLVSHVRQTLKNTSEKTIEVQLSSDVINRLGMTIYLNGEGVYKKLNPPRLHDSTYRAPGNEYHVLPPGQEKSFTYKISDFMTELPRENVLYSVGIRSAHGYRYMNESQGSGELLRYREADTKKQYVEKPFFEGVRLK